jgi:methylenetetrahydrofolate--tRNA-(uracil-5-)-methyltransferase
MLAGRYAAALAHGQQPTPAPRASANGSLTHYITHAESKRFQPANITFDLLPPLEEDLRRRIRDKKERHRIQCERALSAWDQWLEEKTLCQPCLRATLIPPSYETAQRK